MDKLKNDERFKDALTNPKYFKTNKKDKKVKLDKRFQRILTDKDFTLKYSVDSKGKPLKQSANEDLKKYYEYEEETNQEKVSKMKKEKKKSEESSESEEESEEESGSSSSESGSSSDEEDSKNVSEEEVDDQMWDERDADTATTDEATRRLAICNMDWDHIKAIDLFTLFTSFKPSAGSILSVSIYPSDFGKERMKQEEMYGPQELKADKNEDEKQYNERLRKYQLNRLKYYYAVMECDSVQTADSIYNNCNNIEFEASSTVIDLRFIPDDMDFDSVATDTATSLAPSGEYQPSPFFNTALHQAKVNLTWDETPMKRKMVLNKDLRKITDEDDNLFNQYVASDSEDDVKGNDDGENSDEEKNDDDDDEKENEDDDDDSNVDSEEDENEEDVVNSGENDESVDDEVDEKIEIKSKKSKNTNNVKTSNNLSKSLNSKANKKIQNSKDTNNNKQRTVNKPLKNKKLATSLQNSLKTPSTKMELKCRKRKASDDFDDQVNKYKDLLKQIKEDEDKDKKDDDIDMEVTWKTGTLEAAEEVIRKKRRSEMTSFEKYHEKRKMKRKIKKLNKLQSKRTESEDEKAPQEEDLSETQRANLQLLMMDAINVPGDDDDGVKKKLSKRQKLKQKIKMKKTQKEQEKVKHQKVSDPRFAKMYTDEDYFREQR